MSIAKNQKDSSNYPISSEVIKTKKENDTIKVNASKIDGDVKNSAKIAISTTHEDPIHHLISPLDGQRCPKNYQAKD